MPELFQDILDIDGVQGVFFVSADGELIFNARNPSLANEFTDTDWHTVTDCLSGIRETEIVFDHNMLYITQTRSGYLVVVMSKSTPLAMVRLNCSIVVPSLEQKADKPSGLRRFFRRKT